MSKKRNNQQEKPEVVAAVEGDSSKVSEQLVEAFDQQEKPEVVVAVESFTVRNSTHSPYQVFSTTVVSGGEYSLTEDDEKDEKGCKRLARAIDLGHLIEC